MSTPRERLADERNIWLVTVREDGRPHVAPVWFVYVDARFWIGTGATSLRVRNLRHREQVVACLEDGDRPIVAEGDAIVHLHDRPESVIAAFARKYDWDVTVGVDVDVGELVLVEIRPRRWLFGVDLPVVDASA